MFESKYYRTIHSRTVDGIRLSKSEYAPGRWSAWHRHRTARFVYVVRGRFYEQFGGDDRDARQGTAIFRPLGELHREDYTDEVVCLSVALPVDWIGRLADHSVKLTDSRAFSSPVLCGLFRKICLEIAEPDDLSDLAIGSLLTEVAVEMHRDGSRLRSKGRPAWLRRAVEYVHDNFASNPLIEDVATAAAVHPAHLSRVFKRVYGCTVADYARRLRVDLASELIADPDLTLAEIAVTAGFSDQSHLTRVFRQMNSITPDRYRREKRVHR